MRAPHRPIKAQRNTPATSLTLHPLLDGAEAAGIIETTKALGPRLRPVCNSSVGIKFKSEVAAGCAWPGRGTGP